MVYAKTTYGNFNSFECNAFGILSCKDRRFSIDSFNHGRSNGFVTLLQLKTSKYYDKSLIPQYLMEANEEIYQDFNFDESFEAMKQFHQDFLEFTNGVWD